MKKFSYPLTIDVEKDNTICRETSKLYGIKTLLHNELVGRSNEQLSAEDYRRVENKTGWLNDSIITFWVRW